MSYRRIAPGHNIAWQFMQSHNVAFAEAIKLAAEIVSDAQVAACELTYVDMMELFKKLNAAAADRA